MLHTNTSVQCRWGLRLSWCTSCKQTVVCNVGGVVNLMLHANSDTTVALQKGSEDILLSLMTLISGMWDGQSDLGWNTKILFAVFRVSKVHCRPGIPSPQTTLRGVLLSVVQKNNYFLSHHFSNVNYAIFTWNSMSISIMVTPLEGWSRPTVTRPFCEDLGTRLTLVYNVVGVANPKLHDKSAFLEHSLLMQSCWWKHCSVQCRGVRQTLGFIAHYCVCRKR